MSEVTDIRVYDIKITDSGGAMRVSDQSFKSATALEVQYPGTKTILAKAHSDCALIEGDSRDSILKSLALYISIFGEPENKDEIICRAVGKGLL